MRLSITVPGSESLTLLKRPFSSPSLDTPPAKLCNALKASSIGLLVQRIQALLNENHHLIFGFSTSMLFFAAPRIFLAGATTGVFTALNHHFGMGQHSVEHLSWETAKGVIGGIVFVCGLIFHYHIQCFWGGIAAGSHLYRVWNGDANHNGLHGFKALDYEMHLLTEEFRTWLKPFIPKCPAITPASVDHYLRRFSKNHALSPAPHQ